MIADIRNEPASPEPLIELFGMEKFMEKKLGDLSGGSQAEGQYCIDLYV